ncbi:HET-domain-containing protein [Durotheca rogersii]|uniref:HET-domain-containing protein n=1 Tax=Durotheca rogersii TaxID=419775 RepID=UPI0022207A49|nr:HET-domain-containing protein [Durotheca rogersii]KAI5860675.1 HET-domain-containing protein [Durotheca rogersii]
MRLINVRTFRIHRFQGRNVPPYAILSHTWTKDEVSLQDWHAGRGKPKQGFKKIRFVCEQARRDRLGWAWVDTCCIDQTSSAELSEAINSMYRWYRESHVCYAYLEDVMGSEDREPPLQHPSAQHPSGRFRARFQTEFQTNFRERYQAQFEASRWFTRAWTLQELIAPRNVVFYDCRWERIGNRSKGNIAKLISTITNIPLGVVQGTQSPSQYSVAQKMSWAAHRSSTRPEDVAYSLLGLFDINMPLLYGEGDKAFVRLQEEILRETDDHSLLCWTVPSSSPRAWTLEGIFAKSPDDFAGSSDIRGHLFDSGSPSAVTNRGLQTRLGLAERRYGDSSHLYHDNAACSVYDAALNAGRYDSRNICVSQVSIILVRTPQITSRHLQSINRYARLVTSELGLVQMEGHHAEETEALRSQAELTYIHKTLLSWEQDRFGVGGIHLQNIPICKALVPFRQSPEGSGQICDYAVSAVLHSEATGILDDATTVDVTTNPQDSITWSPVYGCIRFGEKLSKTPMLPYIVVFKMKSPIRPESFDILLAWDSQNIHFSLGPGTAHSFATQTRKKIIGWPNHRKRQGNIWEMYGEVAKTREVIGDYCAELTLIREDPKTTAGEAAGNRLHLLIRASITKKEAD